MGEKHFSDDLSEGVLKNHCSPNNKAKMMKVLRLKYTILLNSISKSHQEWNTSTDAICTNVNRNAHRKK